MELRQYLQLLRRWVWFLILGSILGLAGGYVGSLYQTPIYQASTQVLVSRAPQERASDVTYLSDQQLTQTYIQLLGTQSVLQAAGEHLGYTIEPKRIQAQQIRDTQIIQIKVEDASPQRAMDIANELVEVLVEESERIQAGRYASTEQSLQVQINQVEEQITNLQEEIDRLTTEDLEIQLRQVQAEMTPLQEEATQLQQDIAALTPAYTSEKKTELAEKQARLAQIQPLLTLYQQIYSNLIVLGKPTESDSSAGQLARLQSTLDLYQQIYINLLNNLESVRLAHLQSTPNVVQIEVANLPLTPIRPRPLANALLAGAIGLMIAAGAVFLIEYLDDTLHTPEDVERTLNLSVIGYIAEMQYAEKSREELYVARQPRSPVSEAFRSLRTNLEFAAVDKPLKTILVTSVGPGEGKTTVAVNLAAIFAQGGKEAVVLDADMRRPFVHRLLGISNRVGLSDLFRNPWDPQSVIRAWDGMDHFKVITSGSLPPNPSELLASKKMEYLLSELQAMADIIILDSPPNLVADAQILAAKVDGVLIVVQPGRTHLDSARAAVEQFERAKARVLGVVFNRIPRDRAEYYGGYRYYYSSYYQHGYQYYRGNGTESGDAKANEQKPEGQSLLRELLNRAKRKQDVVSDPKQGD